LSDDRDQHGRGLPIGDRSDIERLLIKHGRTIDLVRIRQALEQLLNMLDEPERLVEFDRLVSDALREQ